MPAALCQRALDTVLDRAWQYAATPRSPSWAPRFVQSTLSGDIQLRLGLLQRDESGICSILPVHGRPPAVTRSGRPAPDPRRSGCRAARMPEPSCPSPGGSFQDDCCGGLQAASCEPVGEIPAEQVLQLEHVVAEDGPEPIAYRRVASASDVRGLRRPTHCLTARRSRRGRTAWQAHLPGYSPTSARWMSCRLGTIDTFTRADVSGTNS